MKRCSRCHQFKPETEFTRNKSAKDRLYSWCKRCHRSHDMNRNPGMREALEIERTGIAWDMVSLDQMIEKEYREASRY